MDSSKLFIELSAVRGLTTNDGVETCNNNLTVAEAFAVYIHNPLAFHILDFFPDIVSLATYPECFKKAFDEAKLFAKGLAEHLGCPLEIRCSEPEVILDPSESENSPTKPTFDDVRQMTREAILKRVSS